MFTINICPLDTTFGDDLISLIKVRNILKLSFPICYLHILFHFWLECQRSFAEIFLGLLFIYFESFQIRNTPHSGDWSPVFPLTLEIPCTSDLLRSHIWSTFQSANNIRPLEEQTISNLLELALLLKFHWRPI